MFNTKIDYTFKHLFLGIIFTLCSVMVLQAQYIMGSTSVTQNDTESYYMNFQGATVYSSYWDVTGGTILNQDEYMVTVKWTTPGDGVVVYVAPSSSVGFFTAVLNVTVASSTPSTPPSPYVVQMDCGQTTLARNGAPPSGVTWYWQSSYNGTSTSSSGTFKTVYSGNVYYLRARSSSGIWSPGYSYVLYSVNQPTNWYTDTDGDGFGDYDDNDPVSSCNPVTGKASNKLDYCVLDANTSNNGCEAGYVHENLNWIISKAYDINGNLKAGSKSYFDVLGKGIQSQSVDTKTNKTWATQTMYDSHGRPAFQSMSAPINSTGTFLYNTGFIKKTNGSTYTEADFEGDPYDPEPVGSTTNTLGHYYSISNIDTNDDDKGNSYHDITSYPFSRTIYSKLNPSGVLKTVGGKQLDLDLETKSFSHSMPASHELSQTDAFNDTKYNDIKTIKTVVRDAHGIETVMFTDTDGKTLAAARSGNEDHTITPRNMDITITEQGFVDVHIPVGCTGITITANPSNESFTVYDLITETEVTTSMANLSNGFYRVSITDLSNYQDDVVLRYKENYYDYSLNEYDKAGRLIYSYQPLNKLKSEFKYNALGQLIYSKSPDEGEAEFKYRKDGQIRFSQNSKQASAGEFIYTNYDELGRPVESGVFTEGTITFVNADSLIDNVLVDIAIDNDGLPNTSCTEQHFTLYDDTDTTALHAALSASGIATSHYPKQHFVAGNVSKTYTLNPATTTTWYSYDVYGRVEWVVQKIDGLGTKTIDYKYDPITGNVLEVDYQKHISTEHFVHKYTYNLIDQLTQVETSTNGTTFTNQAKYFYYETGALRRIELADDLQGIDYIYNLAGQLKAINHPSGDKYKDPGKDGVSNGFSPDVFSMTLDYFDGDYNRTNPPTAIHSVTGGQDQYNGNIKAMTWKTNHPIGNANTQTYYYQYNRNNWIKDASLNTPTPGSSADYNVYGITYDANGNIITLNRNKHTESGSNVMDKFTYNYKPNTNQLDYVNDIAAAAVAVDDLKDQNAGNYSYNEIGQLTSNTKEGITYKYNAAGLVTEVKKNNQPVVKFFYNDKGHRVRKESYTSGSLTHTEYYIRDAGGNTLAVYKNGNLTEMPIYGSSRIGVHYKTLNKDRYQLTDHLGNVRAVVERSVAQPKATTDYYPFGMVMPGRQTMDGTPYRYAYQGQEKDSETGKEAFQLRLWDGRIGRWLTTDPKHDGYSPYWGMNNNPIGIIDPDGGSGQSTDVRKLQDGTYEVVGGDLNDGDTGIYVVDENGQRTGEKIGYSVTMSSFFNHEKDQNGWQGIIDLSDYSGVKFLQENVYSGSVNPVSYFRNAGRGEDYDFKRIDQPKDEWDSRPYHYRGMILNDSGVMPLIASARDIGNLAAGYMLGNGGYSWGFVRNGFDLKESLEPPRGLRREQAGSILAQKVGWEKGYSNYLKRKYNEIIKNIHNPKYHWQF